MKNGKLQASLNWRSLVSGREQTLRKVISPHNGTSAAAKAPPPAVRTVAPNGAASHAGKEVAWPVFWRVEGSLAELTAVRPVAYFTWNAHTFAERWSRRGGLFLEAMVRPFLYASHRAFATRVLHALLHGVSQDRLDLLGEEYFHYLLKPQLKPEGVERLRECMANGQVVLVSQGLDHVMRPLAAHLGVERLVANRLEFRHGTATGRLLDPVIRPRGPLARYFGVNPDGRISAARLLRDLGLQGQPALLAGAIQPVARPRPHGHSPVVVFGQGKRTERLSVGQALRGKQIMLIGVTGFIAKVWLENVLANVPDVGKIYVLIRRQRSTTARRRFEKIVEESPVFDRLEERHGAGFAQFLAEKVEVVEGDVSQPHLGIDCATHDSLAASLDLVVNSSGLTDFNPDLRDALAGNVESVANLIDFLRQSDHAALLHLSTCYVVGGRDGRVKEELRPNYTPVDAADFDAEREWQSLRELVRKVEERAQSPELEAALKRQARRGRPRNGEAADPGGSESFIRKNRLRWMRNRLTRAGTRRAKRFGWPNTYTFTKSLAESLLATRGAGLPIAVARPSIVETSTDEPFRGWNEGINTSAPLSYLLGTYFRQLPSNERKYLDLIPVDMVCRGMTLIAAALIERRQEPLYQLATSAHSPCDMGRSIELTALAHRKHYRAQQGLEHWLRMRFDTIPVSKQRYQNLSVPAQKFVVKGINRAAAALQFKRPPLGRMERDLARVEKLIELYEPFILHNEQVFESQNLLLLSEALPAEEREGFSYDPEAIDWWDYWINIHVPALRKWCYPLIEGHALESKQRREFHFPEPATAHNEARAGGPSGPQATWRSS